MQTNKKGKINPPQGPQHFSNAKLSKGPVIKYAHKAFIKKFESRLVKIATVHASVYIRSIVFVRQLNSTVLASTLDLKSNKTRHAQEATLTEALCMFNDEELFSTILLPFFCLKSGNGSGWLAPFF